MPNPNKPARVPNPNRPVKMANAPKPQRGRNGGPAARPAKPKGPRAKQVY